MNRILTMNGKQYRITGLTTVISFKGETQPSCTAEFFYDGKWHEVKNYQICGELRTLYDEQICSEKEKRKARTAQESRLIYTAHGIKGKNGEKIGGCGDKVDYLPCFYDFDPVRLELRLTLKGYKSLIIIPAGCNVRNDSDLMTDYFDNDHLTIPATAGAEFLAAANGYKKHLEVIRRKSERMPFYHAEYEHAQRYADALKLAEQIASGRLGSVGIN